MRILCGISVAIFVGAGLAYADASGLRIDESNPAVRQVAEAIQADSERDTRELGDVPVENRLNILITNDPVVSPETGVGYQLNRIAQAMPGTTLTYRVRTVQDFVRAMRTRPGEAIQSVFLMGLHGNRDEQSMPHIFIHDETGGSEELDFDYVARLRKTMFKHHPIAAPRFLPGAAIISDSCDVMPLPKEGTAKILNGLKALATGFGLQSGWLYANYTAGTHISDLVPPGDLKGSVPAQIMSGIFDLLAPLTYPLGLAMEHSPYYNQGYFYGFNKGETKEVVLKTGYDTARGSRVRGKVLYSK